MTSTDNFKSIISTLPPEFIKHLRTVFDTLDKGNNGYIKVSDLEAYWKKFYRLDKSVSESLIIKRLNEIAPCNMGLISFPRLCTGVKEALMQAKIHKKRKISFLHALSLEDVATDILYEDDAKENNKDSGFGDISENSTLDSTKRMENGNFRSPPTSPLSTRINYNNHSCHGKSHEKGIQNLLDVGLQMISQINSWYSHQNSKFYNREIKELPIEEIEKVRELNDGLRNILCAQRTVNMQPNDESSRNHKQVVKELKDKISTLEGEKSLLIRELFQLKSQLRTTNPSTKRYTFDV